MSSLRVLRLPEVQFQTGLKKSTVYQLMSLGEFPRSIQLNKRTVGWLAHEIDEWIESRVEESRHPSTLDNEDRP